MVARGFPYVPGGADNDLGEVLAGSVERAVVVRAARCVYRSDQVRVRAIYPARLATDQLADLLVVTQLTHLAPQGLDLVLHAGPPAFGFLHSN